VLDRHLDRRETERTGYKTGEEKCRLYRGEEEAKEEEDKEIEEGKEASDQEASDLEASD
jgi:hypothetical protein